MSENEMAKSVGFSIVRMIKNYFLLSVIIGLLVTNVASIISSPFNNSMFRLLSHLPFSEFLSNSPSIQQKRLIASYKQMTKRNLTLSKKLQKAELASNSLRIQNRRLKLTSQQRLSKISKARGIGRRIAMRTARNVSVNLSSLAGEVVPVAGVAVIATVTAMDIADACATESDLDIILRMLGDSGVGQEKGKVCGMNMPNIAELKQGVGTSVSQAVKDTKSNAYYLNKAVDKVIYDAYEHWFGQ